MLQVDQFHFCAGQIAVGTKHMVGGHIRLGSGFAPDTCYPRLGQAGFAQQNIVNRMLQFAFVDARTHGGIALWVEVNHQHAPPNGGECRGQVDSGGGFTHAAFLICNTKDISHSDLFL